MENDNLDLLWGKYKRNSVKNLILKDGTSINIDIIDNNLNLSVSKNYKESEKMRYIIPNSGDIFIKPSFPDLPIVIRSSNKLSILPGQRFEAYIEVPLLLTINYMIKQKNQMLYEFPLNSLSRSFFGNSDSGEVAYSLESPLYNHLDEYDISELYAYCPISIFNKSNDIMKFERMILRVPNLSIYQYPDFLLGSPVSVVFTSREQNNQTTIKKTKPLSKFEPTNIYSPRQQIDTNMLRKSFYFIKTIYNG